MDKYNDICFELQNIINQYDVEIEGNIYWFQEKKSNLYDFSKNANNIMEIGFNAGHSCVLYLLSNSTSKIQLFDLGEHVYSQPCFEYLNNLFPERLTIIWGDSTETVKIFKTDIKYDLIHIDGGHTEDIIRDDIINCKNLSDDNTLIIIDDIDMEAINKTYNEFINKKFLKQVPLIYETQNHVAVRYL